jgi:predicted ATPase
MLRSLKLSNFTVFAEAECTFGKHLNVVVGENGLGKTHILKAAYSVLAVSARGAREFGNNSPTKAYLQPALASKLRAVFKPDELGRLTRRQAGRNRTEVACSFADSSCNVEFSFNAASKSEVTVDLVPKRWVLDVPVYFPTRELLTTYPGFVPLYETTHLEFDETWRDTAIALGAPLAKGPRDKRSRDLLKSLDEAMGGAVELDSAGRFYLKTQTGQIEMHLVAEGLRKLAMVARLIANGSLLDKGYLFWDEPDANLNPKLIKLVARTILNISRSGVQVFVATHSLFLLREIFILQQTEYRDLDTQHFGLHASDNGVKVRQGQTVDDVGDISMLDEELLQSERYLNLP